MQTMRTNIKNADTDEEDTEYVDKSQKLKTLIIIKNAWWVFFYLVMTIIIGITTYDAEGIGFPLGFFFNAVFSLVYLFLPTYKRLNGRRLKGGITNIIDYVLYNRTKPMWGFLKGTFWGLIFWGMLGYDAELFAILAFSIHIFVWPLMFIPDFIRLQQKLVPKLRNAIKNNEDTIDLLQVVPEPFRNLYRFQQKALGTYLLGSSVKGTKKLLDGWVLEGFNLVRHVRLSEKATEKTHDPEKLERIATAFLGKS